MSEDTQEKDSTNDAYDKDSSTPFGNDTASTASQQDELEVLIEYMVKN